MSMSSISKITSQSVEEVIDVCKALAPTFGGINLEDIKAPECFEIEERLKEELDIPVFHDDQHGTAIISGAALLNALEITGKRMEDIKVVINGAGASAIATGKFFKSLGVGRENILMLRFARRAASSARRQYEYLQDRIHRAHPRAHAARGSPRRGRANRLVHRRRGHAGDDHGHGAGSAAFRAGQSHA